MNILEKVRGKLIVSCQAEEGFPLNSPQHLAALAATTEMGGAAAIRASIPMNIRAIQQAVDVPIIGIYKKEYPNSDIHITPTIAEVEELLELDIAMIALDATQRRRPDGQTLAQLVSAIRERSPIPLMADISTYEEGLEAAHLGFEAIGTTLSGYTDYSRQQSGPNIQLIHELSKAVSVPVIAEGRIHTPDDVRKALDAGAYAVVVGSMITRPHLITESFVSATKQVKKSSLILAVDIGGTKIAGGIVNAQGEILQKKRVPTPISDGEAIGRQVIQVLETILDEYQGEQVAAIGISTGGQINAEGEIIGGYRYATGLD